LQFEGAGVLYPLSGVGLFRASDPSSLGGYDPTGPGTKSERVKSPDYYIARGIPVKVIHVESGGIQILTLNLDTGDFVSDRATAATLWATTGDVEAVTEQEFDRRVETLKARLQGSEK
jgi:hypothetical protein